MRAAGEQLGISGWINVRILACWTFCSLPPREQKWTTLIALQLWSRKHNRTTMNTKQAWLSLLRFMKIQPLQRKGQTQAEVWCGQKNKREKKKRWWWIRHWAGKYRGSPWNAETTARLPVQFYTPIVSHLNHQPLPTLNLVSSLCLHLFCVSVQDVRSQAVRNVSQMSQGEWCVKQTWGGGLQKRKATVPGCTLLSA